MVHEFDLCCLGITSHLFDVSCCGLGAFHLLGKLAHLACKEPVKVHTSFIYCLGDKLLIFEKKQKISLCNILPVSGGYLARLICVWTALYHSSMLLVLCLKLVNKSKWALTSFTWGLQNSSKHSQIVSKLRSSLGRLQDTYWSIPKSPLQATNFLAFLMFWECCKLSFLYVFTFTPPLQKPMV